VDHVEPYKGLLDRKFDPDFESLLAPLADTLDGCVNCGTQVLGWLNRPTSSYGDLAVVMLFRHVVEMMDGIAVLVRAGCAEPTKLLLRSMLESGLGLKYICETKVSWEERTIAYQVCYAHERIRSYRRMDPSHQEGKHLKSVLEKDGLGQSIVAAQQDMSSQIENLERMLAKPEFAPVEAQYQSHRSKHPKWYSLNSGPNSVQELANHLGYQVWYEILYRYWSEETHAADAIGHITRGSDGNACIEGLRHPRNLQQSASLAMGLFLDIGQTVIDSFVPERRTEFAKWYVGGVRDVYLRVVSTEPILTIVK